MFSGTMRCHWGRCAGLADAAVAGRRRRQTYARRTGTEPGPLKQGAAGPRRRRGRCGTFLREMLDQSLEN